MGVAKALAGGQAAGAGDEAIAQALERLGKGPDLDRLAQAGVGDGDHQFGQRLLVQAGAVADEGGGVDLGDGQGKDLGGVCGHGRLLAGGAQGNAGAGSVAEAGGAARGGVRVA
jgi:hypothetical protein